ncbi:MAG: hypothetical protein U5K56_13745 [Halioglobus sp.]|nr:hypothetical protein [Halioglobus sp.]
MSNFIKGFEEAGYLTTSANDRHFKDEPLDSPVDAGDQVLFVPTPTILMADAGAYLWYSHGGRLLARLSLAEAYAAAQFCTPATAAQAWTRYTESAPADPEPLARDRFEQLVSRLAGVGALVPADAAAYQDDVPAAPVAEAPNPRAVVQAGVDEKVAEHDERQGNANLPEVVPVNTSPNTTPASLGFVMAYAMEYRNGALLDKFSFVPLFLADEARLIERAAKPGIFLFSNYLWTVEDNLKLSAAIKAVNPANITIHGGPSTPKYEKDSEDFFADNPHVDIIRAAGRANSPSRRRWTPWIPTTSPICRDWRMWRE